MSNIDNKRVCHYVSLPQLVLKRIDDDPAFSLQLTVEDNKTKGQNITSVANKNNTSRMAKTVKSPVLQRNTRKRNPIKLLSNSPKVVLRNRLNNAKLKSKYSLKALPKSHPKSTLPKNLVGQKSAKPQSGKQISPGQKRPLKSELTISKSGKHSVQPELQKRKPKPKSKTLVQVIQPPSKVVASTVVGRSKQKVTNHSKQEIKVKPIPKQRPTEKSLAGIVESSANKTMVGEQTLRNGGKRLSQDSMKDGTASKKVKYCLNDDWDVEAMVKELHDEKPSPPLQKKQLSATQPATPVQTKNEASELNQSFDDSSETSNPDSDPIYDKLIQALSTNSVTRYSGQQRAHTNKGTVVKKKVIGGLNHKVKSLVHKNNVSVRPKAENLQVKSVEAINFKAENELVSKTPIPKADTIKKTAKVEPLTPPVPQPTVNIVGKKSGVKPSGNKEEPVNLLSKLVGVAISPSEMQVLPISKSKSKKQATLNQVTITKVKATPKTQLVSPTQKPAIKIPETIADITNYEENVNYKGKGISRMGEEIIQKMVDDDNMYPNVEETLSFESEAMMAVEPEPRTIYDMMQEVSLNYPSWNLHIMPDSNTFCIAQVTRGRLGMPVLNKSIELDAEFNAKVYVHQLHCKRFDGKYDCEETITALIDEINILAV